MLMCTRCKKRPAVVFVSNGVDGQPTQGLCLVCARELGIKPVNDIMEKMGITDEELEAATAQMTELMNLPGLAVICTRAFADIQVSCSDLYQEGTTRASRTALLSGINHLAALIEYRIPCIGVSAFLGVIQIVEGTLLALGIRPAFADTV